MGIKARVLASIIVFTMLLVFSVGRSAYAGSGLVIGPGDIKGPPDLAIECGIPDLDLAINRPMVEALMNCADCTAQCVFDAVKGIGERAECAVKQLDCVDCAVGRLDSSCIISVECAIGEGPGPPPGL